MKPVDDIALCSVPLAPRENVVLGDLQDPSWACAGYLNKEIAMPMKRLEGRC